MDLLHIHDLSLRTTVGIHAWEKLVKQTIVLEIDLACDCRTVAASDDIDKTIDYDALVNQLESFLLEQNTGLIETLAEKIAHFLFDITNTNWIKIKLTKAGAIAKAKNIAVTIIRERSSESNKNQPLHEIHGA